jgi:hypothetical protein
MKVVPVTIGALAPTNDVGVLDLARSGAARGLQGTFDDMPEAVDGPGAEAAAKGVERQFAVELAVGRVQRSGTRRREREWRVAPALLNRDRRRR